MEAGIGGRDWGGGHITTKRVPWAPSTVFLYIFIYTCCVLVEHFLYLVVDVLGCEAELLVEDLVRC